MQWFSTSEAYRDFTNTLLQHFASCCNTFITCKLLNTFLRMLIAAFVTAKSRHRRYHSLKGIQQSGLTDETNESSFLSWGTRNLALTWHNFYGTTGWCFESDWDAHGHSLISNTMLATGTSSHLQRFRCLSRLLVRAAKKEAEVCNSLKKICPTLLIALAWSFNLCIWNMPLSPSQRMSTSPASCTAATAMGAPFLKCIPTHYLNLLHCLFHVISVFTKGRLGCAKPLFCSPKALWKDFHVPKVSREKCRSFHFSNGCLWKAQHKGPCFHLDHLGLGNRTTQKQGKTDGSEGR